MSIVKGVGASSVAQMIKNLPTVQEAGFIPGSGRSLGGGNGSPLQSSRLENPTDRGAWLGGSSPWGHKGSDTSERLTL